MPDKLDTYRLLGKSGLRVSPLSLGTMTFGAAGWGSDDSEAQKLFDHYVDRGGNFIDTANFYGNAGGSERLVGTFAQGRRDRLVIATKYALTMRPGDANASGAQRKTWCAPWKTASSGCKPTISTCSTCMCGTPARLWRRCCAASTISCAPARSYMPASPIRRPGRLRGCRRSPTFAAGPR